MTGLMTGLTAAIILVAAVYLRSISFLSQGCSNLCKPVLPFIPPIINVYSFFAIPTGHRTETVSRSAGFHLLPVFMTSYAQFSTRSTAEATSSVETRVIKARNANFRTSCKSSDQYAVSVDRLLQFFNKGVGFSPLFAPGIFRMRASVAARWNLSAGIPRPDRSIFVLASYWYFYFSICPFIFC